jgi:hypothetical protein
MKSEADPHVVHSPNFPRGKRVNDTLVARLLLSLFAQVQAWCIREQKVYSFSEAFSNAYPYKELKYREILMSLVRLLWFGLRFKWCSL